MNNRNDFNILQEKWLKESSIRSAWERAGKDTVTQKVDLSLGNPTLIPPSKRMIRELKKAISGKIPNNFFAYIDNAGHLIARKAVSKDLNKSKYFNSLLTEKNIVMTPGASGAINSIFSSILNASDEVIILAPYFVDYPKYVLNYSSVPKIVNLEPPSFDIDIDLISRAITLQTKAIIINSPNNPTGKVYSEEKLIQLAKLLNKKSREIGNIIYLISDEVYREIVYDDFKFFSPCAFYDNSIMVYSFSKSLNIPGERIGYAAINPKLKTSDILYELIKLSNRTLGFANAPSFFQRIIPNLLPLEINNRKYVRVRNKIARALKRSGFEYQIPEGSFYFFVKLPIREEKFTEIMKSYGLYTVNSKPFGMEGYFRIAFCVPEEIIDIACSKIIEIGNKLRKINSRNSR